MEEIVKRAEPYKFDICLASRIPLRKKNHPFFKRMEIMAFDTHWRISTIISPYKYRKLLMQLHSSEGCLFSSEKSCDVSVGGECCDVEAKEASSSEIVFFENKN